MLCASSPYAKRGVLYDAFREHYGRDGGDVLFWKSPTRVMNPSVPESFIASETAKDPAAAASEYGAEFRDDISSFVSAEIVDSAIIKGVTVIPPSDEGHFGFIDVSGGAKDSHAAAVAFKSVDGTAVLACARELKTASTEQVVAECYNLSSAYADRYGAAWVQDAFARYGIELLKSPFDRSGIYLNVLPALNAGQVKLLDLPRLRSQLLALERRTLRGSGKDVVDHPNAGHDDLINAAAGALVIAASADRRRIKYTLATLDGFGGAPRNQIANNYDSLR
jgi:hypothetical protein